MDYSFGLDRKQLDKYGAKAAVFDAVRDQYKDVPIHPAVKVANDDDPTHAEMEARRNIESYYFVVRASSRYELLPGTAGMTNSARFVHWSDIANKIQSVRKPTGAYYAFTSINGLEEEKALPVLVQPMMAGSFAFVTNHPNREMTMVDFFKDDDGEDVFKARNSFWHAPQFENLEKRLANLHELESLMRLKSGVNSYFARYEKDGPMPEDVGFHRLYLDLAAQLFDPLRDFFGKDWTIQGECGPYKGTPEPVLYQLKPFMPKKKADFKVDESKSNVCFGICRGKELPVVRIKSAMSLSADDFDELAQRSSSENTRENLRLTGHMFELASGMTNQKERETVSLATQFYHTVAAKQIREENHGDLCLAMRYFGLEDGIHFIDELKPEAVVISDKLRTGMIHNRTNLIQSVPVVIFGHTLAVDHADRVRISCDGINSLVEEL